MLFLNAVTKPQWIGEDVNKSSLDLYFFLLFGIGIFNFFLYAFLSSRYRIVDHSVLNRSRRSRREEIEGLTNDNEYSDSEITLESG